MTFLRDSTEFEGAKEDSNLYRKPVRRLQFGTFEVNKYFRYPFTRKPVPGQPP